MYSPLITLIQYLVSFASFLDYTYLIDKIFFLNAPSASLNEIRIQRTCRRFLIAFVFLHIQGV